MRQKGAGGFILLGVVVVAGVLWLRLSTRPPAAASPAPMAAYCIGASKQASPRSPAMAEEMVAAFALSLTSEERSHLEALLEDANVRWEARMNPFAEDLESGSPDEPIRNWLAESHEVPISLLSAVRSEYCGSDGFCVRVLPASEGCPQEFREPMNEAEAQRARFLAWVFGYAVRVRSPNADMAQKVADTLRARAWGGASPIGLVLHGGDMTRMAQPGQKRLREAWERHQGIADRWAGMAGTAGPTGESGARGAEESPRRTTLFADMSPEDCIVLPRLDAVEKPEALAQFVSQWVPGVTVSSL